MYAAVDKRGQWVATFRHWSDARHYEADNVKHRYQIVDVPGTDAAVQTLVGTPIETKPPEKQ